MLLMRPAAMVLPARSAGLWMASSVRTSTALLSGAAGRMRVLATASMSSSPLPRAISGSIKPAAAEFDVAAVNGFDRPGALRDQRPGDVELLLGEETLVASEQHGRVVGQRLDREPDICRRGRGLRGGLPRRRHDKQASARTPMTHRLRPDIFAPATTADSMMPPPKLNDDSGAPDRRGARRTGRSARWRRSRSRTG